LQPPLRSVYAEGEKLLIRAIIVLQFWLCGAVLLLQVGSGVGVLLNVASSRNLGPGASFGGVGGMISVGPALLGGILNYMLAQEARNLV
jgi:hypothetical protein